MKVFIGGPREITALNADIEERLENIIKQGYDVLVGDANGIDASVQRFFSGNDYGRVRIYCMNDTCRNNIGGWPVKSITVQSSRRDFAYYTAKDLAMAHDADYGFMVWSGTSKGSLNNMLNLVELQKKVLVYFPPEKTFYSISSLSELEDAVREMLDLANADKSGRLTAFFRRRLDEARQQSLPFQT